MLAARYGLRPDGHPALRPEHVAAAGARPAPRRSRVPSTRRSTSTPTACTPTWSRRPRRTWAWTRRASSSGAGADEVLDIIAKTFLPAWRSRRGAHPDLFHVWRPDARSAARRIDADPAACRQATGFGIDLERLLPRLAGADVVWLCAPNNPTGAPESARRHRRRSWTRPRLGGPRGPSSSWTRRMPSSHPRRRCRSSSATRRSSWCARCPRHSRWPGMRVGYAIAQRSDHRAAGAAPTAGQHLHRVRGRRGSRAPRPPGSRASQRRPAQPTSVTGWRRAWPRSACRPIPASPTSCWCRIGSAEAAEDAHGGAAPRGHRDAHLRARQPAAWPPAVHGPDARGERATARGASGRWQAGRRRMTTSTHAERDPGAHDPGDAPSGSERRPRWLRRASDISTGVGFYDHLLTSLAHHSPHRHRDRPPPATSQIDEHHTVEDVALVLGDAISARSATGRASPASGTRACPWMTRSRRCALDLSGRPYAVLDLAFRGERVGALSTQLVEHILESLARTLGANLHVTASGRNDHHIAEAIFKALARSLRAAVAMDPRRDGHRVHQGDRWDEPWRAGHRRLRRRQPGQHPQRPGAAGWRADASRARRRPSRGGVGHRRARRRCQRAGHGAAAIGRVWSSPSGGRSATAPGTWASASACSCCSSAPTRTAHGCWACSRATSASSRTRRACPTSAGTSSRSQRPHRAARGRRRTARRPTSCIATCPYRRTRPIVVTETEHGSRFPSIIVSDRIIGFQPHPERSGSGWAAPAAQHAGPDRARSAAGRRPADPSVGERGGLTDAARRVIPCLDVKDGRVVKGVRFVDLTDEGDPPTLAERHAAAGADEIVFLDISAAPEARGTLLDVVERTARRVFVPLTVGGGVRSADEMRDVLRAGADKVAVNTAAIRDPSLLAQLRAALRAPVRGHLRRRARRARDRPGRGRSSSRVVGRPPASTPSTGSRARSSWVRARCCSRPSTGTAPARGSTSRCCGRRAPRWTCRSSRRAARARRRTWSRPSPRATPTRSWPRPSSIATSTPSARSRTRWPQPACRSDAPRDLAA